MPIPTPTDNETADSFIDRCMESETMVTEYPDTKVRYALCSLSYEKAKADIRAEATYTDYPKAAKENAKRALKWNEETKNTRGCGTRVGWARANQLAKGKPISLDTIKRMAAFKRHQQNKDVPYDAGCGGIMWDAWGGTEGIEWAIRKVEQIEKNQ
jgi:hypothetical protein